jgi:hypothetical protein
MMGADSLSCGMGRQGWGLRLGVLQVGEEEGWGWPRSSVRLGTPDKDTGPDAVPPSGAHATQDQGRWWVQLEEKDGTRASPIKRKETGRDQRNRAILELFNKIQTNLN